MMKKLLVVLSVCVVSTAFGGRLVEHDSETMTTLQAVNTSNAAVEALHNNISTIAEKAVKLKQDSANVRTKHMNDLMDLQQRSAEIVKDMGNVASVSSDSF